MMDAVMHVMNFLEDFPFWCVLSKGFIGKDYSHLPTEEVQIRIRIGFCFNVPRQNRSTQLSWKAVLVHDNDSTNKEQDYFP